MRKRYFIYILAVVVAFSYIIAAPSSVYARMGMPDVNVAGLNDDGSTLAEEKAQQERAKKKAEAEAPAPISAQNKNTPANQNAPKQPNALANFQNNPNIPKDPGQQNIGMLNRDKDNSPVDLRDQAGMNQNYTEPSKEQIQQAVAVCIDTLKEDGVDENKAKTACASPVGRQYAFCLVNVEEGKLGTISKDDCFQTMRQEAIVFQDDSNNAKNQDGLLSSIWNDIKSLASSAKDSLVEWWDSPNKLEKILDTIKEHPIETAIDVGLLVASVVATMSGVGAPVGVALAGSLVGRQAAKYAIKELAIKAAERIGNPLNLLKVIRSAGIGGTVQAVKESARSLFQGGAKFVTDYITGSKARAKVIDTLGKERYGKEWVKGSPLEDMIKLDEQVAIENLEKYGVAELPKDAAKIWSGELKSRAGKRALDSYFSHYKWTYRGMKAGTFGLTGIAPIAEYAINNNQIASQARIEDANYDMNAPVDEKMEEIKSKRATKANIIREAYKEHVSNNYGEVQQEVVKNLNVAKTHQNPTNAINKTFEERYGFNYYSEIGTISEIQAKAEGRESAEKNKPEIK
jgi:hypothetical protein